MIFASWSVGREDLVLAAVLELEVVAGDAGQRLRLEAGEAGDAVVLVDDEVADAQVDGGGEPAADGRAARPPGGGAPAAGRGTTASLRSGERSPRRSAPRRRTAAARPRRAWRRACGPRGGRGCSGCGPPRPRARRRRRRGSRSAARARAGTPPRRRCGRARLGACARNSNAVALAGPGDRQRGALGQRLGDLDVEVTRVVGVHRRGHVLPVVAQGGLDLLRPRDHHRRVLAEQVERAPAASPAGKQLGEVAARCVPAPRPRARASSAQLAMLERELRRRLELEPVGLAERALGEGRKPADRLDLVAEELHARRLLRGGGEDVEDVATDRELAAVLDLVDALVAGLDQQLGDVAEIDLLALRRARSLPGAATRRERPRPGRRRWRRRPAGPRRPSPPSR